MYVDSQADRVLKIENPENFCPLCPNKLGTKVHYTVSTNYQLLKLTVLLFMLPPEGA